jgi:hypothetical protein
MPAQAGIHATEHMKIGVDPRLRGDDAAMEAA